FQAEDGIRDLTVTGVQTCALPISLRANAYAPFPPDEDDAAPAATPPEPCPRCGGALADPEGLAFCAGCGYCRSLEEDRAVVALRSEERRVGKGGRAGWARGH